MSFRHHTPATPNAWIVVADRSRARILATEGGDWSQLRELQDLINPAGALKESEAVSDRQGYHAGRPGSLEAGERHTDFGHKVAEPFAQQIVKHLEAGRNNHKFGHLILIAAPLLLGILRQKLPRPLARMVELEIDKDFSKHSISEIATLVASLRSVPD